MRNNAAILMRTVQTVDGEDDVIELQTCGKFAERDGKYFISYEETELTGFEDTVTTIKISDNRVKMSRSGKYNMSMTYETGEKNLCYYETAYGSIAVAVDTKEIINGLTPTGGKILIDYILDADNTTFAHNRLEITVIKER